GLVVFPDERRLLLEHLDEASRIPREIVRYRLQLGNDLLLARGLELRWVPFGEEQIVDELLVLETVEEAGKAALGHLDDAVSDQRFFGFSIPAAQTEIHDDVVVGKRLLDAALLRMQQLDHRAP